MAGRSTDVRRAVGGVAAALLLAAAGCGDPDIQRGGTALDAPESGSSPFAVTHVPEGMQPVTAGVGNAVQEWGADSTGTDEPFTVLAPAGSSDPAEQVLVSITGFEGYQGKLDQTLYMHDMQLAEPITVDGREARHIPAEGDKPGVLVAVRDDDLAVRVVAPDATLEELTEILEAVEVPEDTTRAPEVPSPPDGLEVVGAIDVDAVLAMEFWPEANTDRLHALDTTHAAGWLAGVPSHDEGDPQPADLSVMTLPGRAADIDALPQLKLWSSYLDWTRERIEVGGDPGLTFETADEEPGWAKRAVWRWTESGDIVVVSSGSYRGEPLPMVTLIEVAAGVVPSTDEDWERFVIEMTGGPGLNPDPGRTELARGTHDGLEWLLQNGPYESAEMPGPPVNDVVDPCLKLSDRRRTCVPMSGSLYDRVGFTDGARPRTVFDDLVVISTTIDAASVRVTTPAGTADAPLAPVPDSPARGAVVFVEQAGTASCTDDFPIEPPDGMRFMRIDALDAAGSVIGCIGLGGHPDLGG